MKQILTEKMLKRVVKYSNQQFMAEFFGEHLAKGEGVAWTTAFDGDPLKETGAWSGRPVTGQALSRGVGDVFGPAAAGLNTYSDIDQTEISSCYYSVIEQKWHTGGFNEDNCQCAWRGTRARSLCF